MDNKSTVPSAELYHTFVRHNVQKATDCAEIGNFIPLSTHIKIRHGMSFMRRLNCAHYFPATPGPGSAKKFTPFLRFERGRV